ncbi:MAG: PDZ domain-containing protein [Tannerella sp.]|jgi:tricorn protease|nr:PDZ domain-containing protein [Tannerella sp.]
MKKAILFALALCGGGFTCLQAATTEARLLRFPATNGQEIVFSYAGDLYSVPIDGGAAERLTSSIGYEIFPRFSPDGKTIAFTGQYDGNTEVYSMPAQGGEPVRLTYTSTNARDDIGDRMGPNNIVMTWTPDGQGIVYRNRIGDGFIGQLKIVSKDGGLSKSIPLPEGGFCSYSPDGKRFAYNRTMREFRTWKYYRGGQAGEIWIYDPQKETVENITNNPAQDIFPMWIGNDIYFLSDRNRTMNLFVYHLATKQTEQLTHYTDYDIKFPSVHGNIIVFEKGGYIYKLDVSKSKTPEKVDITLASDDVYARSEIKNGADYITEASLSPNGERLAITARGEVFNVPAKEGVTRNITRTPGAHEREAAFSPDGKYIAYISDRTGETEIYLQSVANEESQPKQMTFHNDTYIRSFVWSPDASMIAYTDRKNRINLIDVKSDKVEHLLQEPAGEFRTVNFSPDSKWLTYTRPAANKFRIVYVYNLASKKEYAVTDKWYDSYSPVFSEDGKYLVFASSRDFRPIYSQTEWNHVYTNMGGIYLALLSKSTPSPFLTKDDGSTPAVKAAAKKDSTVVFDPEGIGSRIVKLPLPGSNYYNFYATGNKVYFYNRGKTKVYDLKAGKEEDVANAIMSVEPHAKKALFMKGDKDLYVENIPQGKADLRDPVNTANMQIVVNYPKEWAQIFDEAWRAYRDGFYQPTMHGVDWKAMKQKYGQLVPYVKNRLDLNYIIGEMIGELECGHAYVTPGEAPRAKRIETGLLGAKLSRDASSGYFRIDKILEGASWSAALRSPLQDPGIDAKAGDYILAVDGVPTNSVKDIYSLLVGKANVPTELLLASKPQMAGAHKVVIKPLADEYPLYHYDWVQNNIRKVDKASGGKIGYIYIPDMEVDGLNEFARYYYPQLDKEGLIIDDRANGGGNVSPMIIERLLRTPYRLTMRRGSDQIGTVPEGTQWGPKVCLINKYSASDGDLFPWSFKATHIGKLIGTRTWGGIIGISSSLPFMDGTDLRVPFFTNYDAKTGKWIIENHGVDPDIPVDNNPIKEWKGDDQQLDAAIQEVMKELKDYKPLPGVPAPRIWAK